MSWRDNSSSANRSSTNDGSGGSMRAGGDVRGTGSGSGRDGRGGLTGGIRRSTPRTPRGIPRPTVFNIPQPVAPTPVTPIASPITPQYPQPGTVTDYFSQPVRMDPGIIAQMLGGLSRRQANPSSFPSRPGVSPRIGVRDKDLSRHPDMGGPGRSGEGYGGGGGGGW